MGSQPKTFLNLTQPSSEEVIMVEINGVRLGSWRRYRAFTPPQAGTLNVSHCVKEILVNGTAYMTECDREIPTDGTVVDAQNGRCPGCYKALEDARKYAVKDGHP